MSVRSSELGVDSGWLGGAKYDQTGTYATDFLAGFTFNVMNLVLIAVLHLRQTRMGLCDGPA